VGGGVVVNVRLSECRIGSFSSNLPNIPTFTHPDIITFKSHDQDSDWWVEEGAENEYKAKFDFVEVMRERTKKLVLRHIKQYQALPKRNRPELLASNFFDLLFQRVPTTGQLVGQKVKLSFFLNSL
jgi:hypothetical protein